MQNSGFNKHVHAVSPNTDLGLISVPRFSFFISLLSFPVLFCPIFNFISFPHRPSLLLFPLFNSPFFKSFFQLYFWFNFFPFKFPCNIFSFIAFPFLSIIISFPLFFFSFLSFDLNSFPSYNTFLFFPLHSLSSSLCHRELDWNSSPYRGRYGGKGRGH